VNGASMWIFAVLIAGAATAVAQPVLVGRVTHPVTDAQANGIVRDPALSGDARYLFFVSSATSLGASSNGAQNLYRYDLSGISHPADSLLLATPVLGSNSFEPSASFDGERFAFETLSTNFGGPQGNFTDIYFGQSTTLPGDEVGFDVALVSRGLGNTMPNDESRTPSISGNGRFIAFHSASSNLVSGDANGAPDIFLADTENLAAAPERISVDSSEVPFSGPSFFLSNRAISHDGRFVVFTARAPAGISGNISDVFLRDRGAGTTTLISRLPSGVVFNSSSDQAAISGNGRFIVFRSFASNGPGNTGSRLWINDRQTALLTGLPQPPTATTCEDPRVSDDADVIYRCNSAINGVFAQAYLYRAAIGDLYRLSSTPANGDGNGTSGNFMDMSANGDYIAFDSAASDLVTGDTNASTDVFLAVDDRILNHLFGDGFE
jgi:Tol biopolymer transport system component